MLFHNDSTDRLIDTIMNIKSKDELCAFLEDLCTVREIKDMSQRLDTAIMLSCGFSYQEIADRVGVSTATISRVNRALNYGADGYRKVIDNMSESEKNIQ